MPLSDQCITCRHYTGDHACAAFPDRIPQEILSGLFDHSQPYEGDHGIQREPLEEAK